jgi:hypothetical protein
MIDDGLKWLQNTKYRTELLKAQMGVEKVEEYKKKFA